MLFLAEHVPNPNDPLMIHMRLKTVHKDTINLISKILQSTVNSRLLGSEYSYEYHGNNLGTVSMDKLMGESDCRG